MARIAGKSIDETSIKYKQYKLTTIKIFHAQWIIDVCNQLSSFKGKK